MTNIREKNIKGNILLQFGIFLFLSNALFKYFMPSAVTKILPIISVLIIIFSLNNRIVFSIKNVHILHISFAFVWFIGCIYSTSSTKGLGFVASYSLSMLIIILIAFCDIKVERIVFFIGVVCSVFSALVIIQPIMPQLVSRIIDFLPYTFDQKYEMNYWSSRLGMYSGIFPDRAAAAFYSSVLICCGLYIMYHHYNKLIQKFPGIAFVVMGALSLLMTAKRGHLVAASLGVLFTYMVYKKAHHQSIIRIVIATIILVVLAFFLVMNLDAARLMVERFTDNDNFYTNRLDIYDNIYTVISDNFLFGTGTASANDILGIGGHNIYLTVFMENGLSGFLLIIMCVLGSVIYTLRVIHYQSKHNNYEYLPNLLFALYIQLFFVIYGFTGNPLYDNYILYFYVFSIAITQNSEVMYSRFRLMGENK